MSETKKAKLSSLIPDAHNANRGTQRGMSSLVKSVSERGVGRGILVDKNGRIIAGNKTVQTLSDLGIEDVIIVPTTGNQLVATQRVDLDLETDEQARLLAYEDNRVGQLDLDFDPAQVVADLQAGIDLVDLWNPEELNVILEAAGTELFKEKSDPGPQIDKAGELQEKWGTATGQVWQLGEHRLICGDCTDKAVVEAVMRGERARLVVTDPPYGVSYADKNKFLNTISRANRIETPIENDHATKEQTRAMWKAAFSAMLEVMDAGAVVYCFMPQGGDQMMMMMMMMMDAGIEPRHELIWLKNNHVLGRVDYAYKHEPILYAWKDSGHKFYGDFQTSILEYPKPQVSDLHPTQKPVALIEKLISNSSRRNEIVYDGFLGSGTTLVACENLSRKCRAVEIDPGYVAVTLECWHQLTHQSPVLLS